MDTFCFATCERRRALEFLAKAYPSRTVRDTPDDAGPLLDLVERDVVRIQDPTCHWPPQVVQGRAWNDAQHDAVIAAAQQVHDFREGDPMNHDAVMADLARYEAEQDRAAAREERLDARAQELARQSCEREPEEVVAEVFDDEDCSDELDALLVKLAGAELHERADIADRLAAVLWKAALIAGRREAEKEEDDR